MTASSLPTDFLGRLRRTLALSGVVLLGFTAAACGDDDDDDGGTGPSADCIDDIDWAQFDLSEDDVQAISVGQNRSGNITTSDVAVEFEGFGTYYYDIFALAVEEDGVVTISVDPSGDFDADVVLSTADGEEIAYQDDFEDLEATEVIEEDLAEGCYVIGVSSPFAEATGSYSISID